MWATASTLLALAVVVVGFGAVSRWSILPAAQAGEPQAGFKRLLYRKWYVDELYDRIVVRPLLQASRFSWRVIDQGLIDGLVNGLGNLARAVGWFGSLFQTGGVNTYAFVLTVGVLVILGVMAF
jgi:NADH-quinone oxidoreductase subunit L